MSRKLPTKFTTLSQLGSLYPKENEVLVLDRDREFEAPAYQAVASLRGLGEYGDASAPEEKPTKVRGEKWCSTRVPRLKELDIDVCIKRKAHAGASIKDQDAVTKLIDRVFPDLRADNREHFIVLILDTKHRVVAVDLIASGGLAVVSVLPREVFKYVSVLGGAAIILVHNHPSGDPTPSNDDRQLTERIKAAGGNLGIRVLDHIIIGSTYVFSFVGEGLL